MPICPRCRSRYDHEMDRCPDCDVVLLEVLEMDGPLPGMDDSDNTDEDDWVEPTDDTQDERNDGALKLLLEEPMPEMAGMIREFLKDCGIGCVVQDGPIGYPHRLPISRARVFVRETDWAEARQLIDQFFRES